MTVTIPLAGIIHFLSVYVIIGAVAYFPLYRWQERFISGNQKQWFPNNYTTYLRGYLFSLVLWPVFLGYNIKEEIRLRRKGIL